MNQAVAGAWLTSYGLTDVLIENAAACPDNVAVVCQDVEITWRQMRKRCRQLAHRLRQAGVASGDRVLWSGQNCHRLLELLFAAGDVGAVVCPLNWRLSAAELAFAIEDCAPRIIVWQEQEIGEQLRTQIPRDASVLWVQHDGTGADSYESWLADAEFIGDQPQQAIPADTPVLMLYTAAFDGRPNGALLSHRALIAQSMTMRLLEGLDSATVYLNSGPMFHIGSLRRTIAVAHAGGRNIMCRRVNAVDLCELIDRHRCTRAFLQPPTMAQMVAANSGGRYDLSSLRSGPGPAGWEEMVTVEPAHTRVSSGYGQTEVAGVVTYRYPDAPSIGARPGPLARVEIHDPDGIPVGAGEVGEIVVRGPMVMTGYHLREELTRLRARGGWHHTNDLGLRESDGSISFVGPLQRIIKSAAENIYPVEVETVLKRHPAVDDVAVLGIPDGVWGQRVKAVIVSTESIAEDELLRFCRSELAGYKCPRLFVFADTLPMTAGGPDRDRIDKIYGGGGYPGGCGAPRDT